MTATLPTGDYLVAVRCPHCKRAAEVPCVIEQVLKVKGYEGSLTVALAAKPVPHDCRQQTIDDESVMLEYVQEAHDKIADSLSEGTSMSVSTVDRETGEVREAIITGRGVAL